MLGEALERDDREADKGETDESETEAREALMGEKEACEAEEDETEACEAESCEAEACVAGVGEADVGVAEKTGSKDSTPCECAAADKLVHGLVHAPSSADSDALPRQRLANGAPSAPSAGSNVDPSRRHAFDLVGAGREASMADFNAFMEGRASYELVAMQRLIEVDTAVRVVCVRHGMGHHNDAFQTASFMNRDAELNRVGVVQARETGRLLRSAGLLECDLLVVISPMTRTIQTALELFGSDTWHHPTVLQPLAAETSVASRLRGPRLARKVVANVQQGDHGSTAAELRKKFGHHPQLDFSSCDAYCVRMGRKWAPGGEHEGKWWHHGHHSKVEASAGDSLTRSAELRAWMAQEALERGVRTILLVSHGGMLKQTFDTEAFANAEFRCFDLTESGDYKPSFRMR